MALTRDQAAARIGDELGELLQLAGVPPLDTPGGLAGSLDAAFRSLGVMGDGLPNAMVDPSAEGAFLAAAEYHALGRILKAFTLAAGTAESDPRRDKIADVRALRTDAKATMDAELASVGVGCSAMTGGYLDLGIYSAALASEG